VENNPTWIAVVAAALTDGAGRWLMQQRPAGKHHAGLWEFPGGKVDPGEIPANALVREIKEELGLTLPAAGLAPATFAESTGADGHAALVILLYTVSDWDGEPEALEGGAVGWFTPAEIDCLPRPPLDVELCEKLFPKSAS